jgi:2-dehydropantoate 2-reductase
MKILIYGAGNIGCLYAALLKESGQDVSILARGERLSSLQSHGIQLENALTQSRTDTTVRVVASIESDEHYDLVLVVLPKQHLAEVTPILAKHRHTPSVLFFGNNAAGFREIIGRLGPNRVLLGFPGAAGVPHEGIIRYLITSRQEQPTTIGELNGDDSPRIKQIAEALKRAGFPVSICGNMDAWLKTHAAKVSPTANALYAAGCDLHRLARTRDALVLMVRAIRESIQVLDAHGIPITPANHNVLRWLPEPVLVWLFRKMLQTESATVKLGHAAQARSEMKTIAGEFRQLAEATSVSTPNLDRLRTHLDPSTDPIADGSATIPLNWSAVWAVAVALGIVLSWIIKGANVLAGLLG